MSSEHMAQIHRVLFCCWPPVKGPALSQSSLQAPGDGQVTGPLLVTHLPSAYLNHKMQLLRRAAGSSDFHDFLHCDRSCNACLHGILQR